MKTTKKAAIGRDKVKVKGHNRMSNSSRQWLARQLNDPYVQRAKAEGRRSRSAYKLLDIAEKFDLFRPGMRVIDLGSTPGGWSEVAAQKVGSVKGSGKVAAIDINPMEPIAGVEFVQIDMMAQELPDLLLKLLGGDKADLLMSDMAPPATGHRATDHLRCMALVEAAATLIPDLLADEGAFLAKVLQGGSEKKLLLELRRHFKSVKHVKPPSSRADSTELYVLALGYRGDGEAFNVL